MVLTILGYMRFVSRLDTKLNPIDMKIKRFSLYLLGSVWINLFKLIC